MKNRKKSRKLSLCLLAALLVLSLLLSACDQGPAAPAAPAESAAPAETAAPEATAEPTPEPTTEPTPEPTEEPAPASPWEVEEPPIEVPEWTSIRVGTVDELLGAIAPETAVVLDPGVYDLTTASDYGQEGGSEWYYWEDVYDGYQLVLRDMDGLQILAPEGAEIVTTPRYANVLTLNYCQNALLAGLTLGHTQEPGLCSGGVLHMDNSDGVRVRSCRLYGCGICGLEASNCEDLGVSFTEIYDCSLWGVCCYYCRGVLLEDCWLHDCGEDGEKAYQLLKVLGCRDFAAVNTRMSDNFVHIVLDSSDSLNTSLLGCTLENNRVGGSLFLFEGEGALVEDCGFSLLKGSQYYNTVGSFILARDRNGDELTSFDLDRMQRRRAEYRLEDPDELPLLPEDAESQQEVRVSTVDELLEAIAPDTKVILAPGTYDLSEAADFGGSGREWYTWDQRYDGPSLRFQGLNNLSLEGAGKGETVILAKPRYAAVFGFTNCDGISLSGLTLGHTDEGTCAGNVLDFVSCRRVSVADCGLFGCGVIGVTGQACRGIRLENTEIYACSYAAAEFEKCVDLVMKGCSVYDCKDGNDRIFLHDGKLLWNDQSLTAGLYGFDHEDCLGQLTGD